MCPKCPLKGQWWLSTAQCAVCQIGPHRKDCRTPGTSTPLHPQEMSPTMGTGPSGPNFQPCTAAGHRQSQSNIGHTLPAEDPEEGRHGQLDQRDYAKPSSCLPFWLEPWLLPTCHPVTEVPCYEIPVPDVAWHPQTLSQACTSPPTPCVRAGACSGEQLQRVSTCGSAFNCGGTILPDKQKQIQNNLWQAAYF